MVFDVSKELSPFLSVHFAAAELLSLEVIVSMSAGNILVAGRLYSKMDELRAKRTESGGITRSCSQAED